VLERWRRAVGSGGKYIRGVRGMEQGAGKSERRAEQCGRAGKWSRRWAAGGRRRCRGAGRSARDSTFLLWPSPRGHCRQSVGAEWSAEGI
jgi:hypothetical protein